MNQNFHTRGWVCWSQRHLLRHLKQYFWAQTQHCHNHCLSRPENFKVRKNFTHHLLKTPWVSNEIQALDLTLVKTLTSRILMFMELKLVFCLLVSKFQQRKKRKTYLSTEKLSRLLEIGSKRCGFLLYVFRQYNYTEYLSNPLSLPETSDSRGNMYDKRRAWRVQQTKGWETSNCSKKHCVTNVPPGVTRVLTPLSCGSGRGAWRSVRPARREKEGGVNSGIRNGECQHTPTNPRVRPRRGFPARRATEAHSHLCSFLSPTYRTGPRRGGQQRPSEGREAVVHC